MGDIDDRIAALQADIRSQREALDRIKANARGYEAALERVLEATAALVAYEKEIPAIEAEPDRLRSEQIITQTVRAFTSVILVLALLVAVLGVTSRWWLFAPRAVGIAGVLAVAPPGGRRHRPPRCPTARRDPARRGGCACSHPGDPPAGDRPAGRMDVHRRGGDRGMPRVESAASLQRRHAGEQRMSWEDHHTHREIDSLENDVYSLHSDIDELRQRNSSLQYELHAADESFTEKLDEASSELSDELTRSHRLSHCSHHELSGWKASCDSQARRTSLISTRPTPSRQG